MKISKSQLGHLPKLAEGGEATVYSYKGAALKVFKDPKVLPAKEQKVKYLLKAPKIPAVIRPTEPVTTGGAFIGYLMPEITSGEPLHSFTKARFVRDHGFTNRDALEIVTKLGAAIEEVHQHGFIIGDVSDNNFLTTLDDRHEIFLIDADSWGINGLPPNAFTETFVPPEAYGAHHMDLTEKTDSFGFAVLAFNLLTRIHPFGGSYKPQPNLNTAERIKSGLSLLGGHDITYNDRLFNWSWMSPDLAKVLEKTFEGDRREPITDELKDQLAHSKYCGVHKLYYYDRYTDCPLCAGVAKLKKVIPAVVIPTATGPKVVLIFSDPAIHLLLDENSYFDTAGNFVYRPTGTKVPREKGTRMYFASNGRYLVTCFKSYFKIQEVGETEEVVIDRLLSSNFAVEGASILYVDRGGQVHKLFLSAIGFQDELLFPTVNPLLALNSLGEYFVASQYPDRLVISLKGRDIEVEHVTKIREYAIKYDQRTKTWLFIYEKPNGAFRTMVLSVENGILYDDDRLRYSATVLSNVCYHGGTVYDPGNRAFTGTNLLRGTSKTFPCDVVDEASSLEFDGKGFLILGGTTIHRFG